MAEEPAEPLVSVGPERPDQGALVGDDGIDQAELTGEDERAGRHPAGDERDRYAAMPGRPDRRHGTVTEEEILADQGSVDVECDKADR